jgi:hypothetical protein
MVQTYTFYQIYLVIGQKNWNDKIEITYLAIITYVSDYVYFKLVPYYCSVK